MGQLSLGFQAGGKAYSEIIFFEDKRALDELETGSFAFGADAGVVAITAGANADAATNGASPSQCRGAVQISRSTQRDGSVHGSQGWPHVRGGYRRLQKFSYGPQSQVAARSRREIAAQV